MLPPPPFSLSLSRNDRWGWPVQRSGKTRGWQRRNGTASRERETQRRRACCGRRKSVREKERETRAHTHTHTRKASNEAQAPLERERKAANGYRRRACLCLCFGKWLMTSRPDLLFCHPTRERNERSARRGRRWTDTGERWAVAVISAALDDGQPWKMTIATKKYFTGGAFERRRYAPWAPHVHT